MEVEDEEWLTANAAAKEKQVSRQAVSLAIRDGRLTAKKWGRFHLVRRSDLDAWTPERRGPKPGTKREEKKPDD